MFVPIHMRFLVLSVVFLQCILAGSIQCRDELDRPQDLEVAASGAGGAALYGTALNKAGHSGGAASGFKSGASEAKGFGSKVGGKKGFAKGASTDAGGYRKGGKRAGLTSAAGFDSKFGKKDAKYKSFAAGHKKAFGTVKTFKHSSGFKFGKGGDYREMVGDSKGFRAKKGFAGASRLVGFKKGAKGGVRALSASAAAKSGFKKAGVDSSGFKKAAASGGKALGVAGAGKGGVWIG